jgi:hypothetical protein
MRTLLWCINLFLVTQLNAQVSAVTVPIRDSISNLANSVIRNSYTEIEFLDEENYIIRHQITTTVLNRNGIREGHLSHFEAERNKFRLLDAKTLAKNGQTLHVFTEGNLNKAKLVSLGGEVRENMNYYGLLMEEDHFPYSTYCSYETKRNGTLNISEWMPNSEKNSGLEAASLKIVLKPEMRLNTKITGDIVLAKRDSSRKSKTYLYEAFPQKPIPAHDTVAIAPSLRMTLSSFTLLGNKGQIDTWESFGNWISDLNDSQIELPEHIEKLVKDTVEKYKSDSLIIKALYAYIQNEYRYMSIQLGIGGWKPQPNVFTCNKGIGDCKALSLLLKCMLNKAGIEAYYCLASMNPEKEIIYPDFPENRFNHAMVCAILNGRNYWIECTSKTLQAGQAAPSCIGTYALRIERDKSKLVKIE